MSAILLLSPLEMNQIQPFSPKNDLFVCVLSNLVKRDANPRCYVAESSDSTACGRVGL